MQCTKRNPFWYDTWVLAAATAFPASVSLFNQSSVAKGRHLTNNPEGNRLPANHNITVKGLAVFFTEMVKADAHYIAKNFWLDVIVNNSSIHDGKVMFYPQTGGVYGIEGADGAISNGMPGYSSFIEFVPADRFSLRAGESFEIKLNNGGAAQNSAAGAGVHVTLNWLVDWDKP